MAWIESFIRAECQAVYGETRWLIIDRDMHSSRNDFGEDVDYY